MQCGQRSPARWGANVWELESVSGVPTAFLMQSRPLEGMCVRAGPRPPCQPHRLCILSPSLHARAQGAVAVSRRLQGLFWMLLLLLPEHCPPALPGLSPAHPVNLSFKSLPPQAHLFSVTLVLPLVHVSRSRYVCDPLSQPESPWKGCLIPLCIPKRQPGVVHGGGVSQMKE